MYIYIQKIRIIPPFPFSGPLYLHVHCGWYIFAVQSQKLHGFCTLPPALVIAVPRKLIQKLKSVRNVWSEGELQDSYRDLSGLKTNFRIVESQSPIFVVKIRFLTLSELTDMIFYTDLCYARRSSRASHGLESHMDW